tara:strand:+ start:283 stop:1050 length:768 start_codon:yes stop_codon:yes gene_type:complete
MARPQRNNVDYFPFYCEEGEKMYYIEETYGNDGFATFIKLLRELAKVDYHYLNLSKPSSLMFLSAKCKISKEVLEAIINDLVDLGKFDSKLWKENKIIWCQDFIDSIQDAYIKRKSKCIDKGSLLLLLDSLGVRKLSKSSNKPSLSSQSTSINPQSKVEYIIEDKRKEELFENWITYRKQINKEIKAERTIKGLADKFNREPLAVVKFVVENSINNSWQGLFWDKAEHIKDLVKPTTETIEERIERLNNEHKQLG